MMRYLIYVEARNKPSDLFRPVGFRLDADTPRAAYHQARAMIVAVGMEPRYPIVIRKDN